MLNFQELEEKESYSIENDSEITENTTLVLNENDDPYNIVVGSFDGPLDLLLSLVKDKNLDIMEIDLNELADRYLEIINRIKEKDIDIASDYLVMAATLLQLKARSLLIEKQEDDVELVEDKNAILRRMAEYKQFKELTIVLRQQEELRKGIYIKEASDVSEYIKPSDPANLDGNASPVSLIKSLRMMFERVHAQKLREAKLTTLNLTADDQLRYIRKLLKENENVTFEQIFCLPSVNHFVITLIALLDLVRRQEIILEQDYEYGPIRIIKGELNAQ